jgi:hypothetical protein
MNERTAPTTRHEALQLVALLSAVEANLSDLSDRQALSAAHALLTLARPLADRVAAALPQ